MMFNTGEKDTNTSSRMEYQQDISQGKKLHCRCQQSPRRALRQFIGHYLIVFVFIAQFHTSNATDYALLEFTLETSCTSSYTTSGGTGHSYVNTEIVDPLSAQYSSLMKDFQALSMEITVDSSGYCSVLLTASFTHLASVEMAETGVIFLEFMQDSGYTFTLQTTPVSVTEQLYQIYTYPDDSQVTVVIDGPCSVYTSIDLCQNGASCEPRYSRPYCSCLSGYCGQFCNGTDDNADCVDAIVESGEAMTDSNKVGTCPSPGSCSGAPACGNDFDCDDNLLCCDGCCQTPDDIPTDTTLYLMGGGNSYGILEVEYNGVRGTVCDSNWNTYDTSVACQQLGFPNGAGSTTSVFGDSSSSATIWLSNVDCIGTEDQLAYCYHSGWGNVDGCTHSMDVALVCPDTTDVMDIQMELYMDTTLVSGSFWSELTTDLDAMYAGNSIDATSSLITFSYPSSTLAQITLESQFTSLLDVFERATILNVLYNAIDSGSYTFSFNTASSSSSRRRRSVNSYLVGQIQYIYTNSSTGSTEYVLLDGSLPCSLLDAEGSCYMGSCATDSVGTPYCSCDDDYTGDYCQTYYSTYTEADLVLTTGSGEACEWYSGIYRNVANSTLDLFNASWMHESSQAYLWKGSDTSWELRQNNRDGSQTTLFIGTLDSNFDWGDPTTVSEWRSPDGTLAPDMQFSEGSTDVNSDLLGFGLAAGDVMLPVSSNGRVNSAGIALPSSVYFKRTSVSSIYIRENGYVSLGAQLDVSAFPGVGITANILAPYIGSQGAGCDGQSVFYHIYSPTAAAADAATLSVAARVNQLVVDADSSLDAFDASLIVVVTWYQTRRNPCSSYTSNICLQDQSNTYQLVLAATDSMTSAIYLYGDGTMSGGVTGAELGYLQQFSTDEEGGADEPESFISTAPTNFPNLDQFPGNTEKDGTWYMRLTPDVVVLSDCEVWYNAATPVQSISACPCDELIIENDESFAVASDLVNLPYVVANATYHRCYSTKGLSPIEAATASQQQLVSDQSGVQTAALITDITAYAGAVFDVDAVTAGWKDKQAFELCCSETNLDSADCELYYQARPINDCSNYQAPTIALLFGDPHFVTLDGFEYTFNPVGEFVMLTAPDFEIQCRTGTVLNEITGEPGAATAFTAFAAKHANTAAFTVQISDDQQFMVLHYGDTEYTLFMTQYITEMTLPAPDNDTSSITISKPGVGTLQVTAQFPSGWLITVSMENQMLSLTPSVPGSYMGQVTGLLGYFDGNPANDLTTPNGTVLSNSSSSEQIYYNFGELWRVTSMEESIFWYANGTSLENFTDTSFVPLFEPFFATANASAQAAEICGEDVNCLLDLSITGNIAVAQATTSQAVVFNEQNTILSNSVPVLEEVAEQQLSVGDTLELTLVATDADGDDLTFIQTGSTRVGNLTNSGIFTWTPNDTTPVNIQFIAKDALVSSAAVTLSIILSPDCVNGEPEWDLAVVDTYTQFRLASCLCDYGYEGTTCETDKDGCADDPCSVFGETANCTDVPASVAFLTGIAYNCSCPLGYDNEDGTCVDVNECDSKAVGDAQDNCEQLCQNTEGSFTCSCNTGYYLASNGYSCEDLDECSLNTDMCSQICTNTAGSYNCSCYPGYTLLEDGYSCNATTACTLDCDHICVNEGGNETCNCFPGYQLHTDGLSCNDTNECEDNPCGQLCNNTDGGYECYCEAGFKLDGNLVNCSACAVGYWGVECGNACTCGANVVSCDSQTGCTLCVAGWEGYNCEQDTDECVDGSLLCPTNASCINTLGSAYCQCDTGYSLNDNATACDNIDECASLVLNLCSQTCIDSVGSFMCGCDDGYMLDDDQQSCDDIDECAANLCALSHYCFNYAGDYECKCYDGYTLSDDTSCLDFDECANNTLSACSDNCTNTDGSYACSCPDGYILGFDLVTCEDYDECSHNVYNCTEREDCVNTMGGYTCVCSSGYLYNSTTDDCEDIDECADMSSGCNQMCINLSGSFQCECYPGYDFDGNSTSICILNGTTTTEGTTTTTTETIMTTTTTTAAVPSVPASVDGSYNVYLSIELNYTFQAEFNDLSNAVTTNVLSQVNDTLSAIYSVSLASFDSVVIYDIQEGSTIFKHYVVSSQLLSYAEQAEVGEILSDAADDATAFTIDAAEYFPLAAAIIIVPQNGTEIEVAAGDACSVYNALDVCQNGADCMAVGQIPICECSASWTGIYCEEENEDYKTLVVSLTTVGVVILIFLATLIALLVHNRNVKEKKRQRESDDSEESSISDRTSTIQSRLNFQQGNWYMGWYPNHWRRGKLAPGGPGRFQSPPSVYNWEVANSDDYIPPTSRRSPPARDYYYRDSPYYQPRYH